MGYKNLDVLEDKVDQVMYLFCSQMYYSLNNFKSRGRNTLPHPEHTHRVGTLKCTGPYLNDFFELLKDEAVPDGTTREKTATEIGKKTLDGTILGKEYEKMFEELSKYVNIVEVGDHTS